jgi:hypothetical protein
MLPCGVDGGLASSGIWRNLAEIRAGGMAMNTKNIGVSWMD